MNVEERGLLLKDGHRTLPVAWWGRPFPTPGHPGWQRRSLTSGPRQTAGPPVTPGDTQAPRQDATTTRYNGPRPTVEDALSSSRKAERETIRATAQREAIEVAIEAAALAEEAAWVTARASQAAHDAASEAAHAADAVAHAALKVREANEVEREVRQGAERDAMAAERSAKEAYRAAKERAGRT